MQLLYNPIHAILEGFLQNEGHVDPFQTDKSGMGHNDPPMGAIEPVVESMDGYPQVN